MLAKIKVWIIGLLSATSAVLFAWAKYKSNKAAKLEKQKESLEAEVKSHEIKDDVVVEFNEEEKEIEDRFEDARVVSNDELSPTLRKLLNDSGASSTDKPSE